MGTDLTHQRALVIYWKDAFNWREQERLLNQLPQFKTTIDGVDIHFMHQRSTNPSALPLVLTHGWPGSFIEFTKIVGPLTDPVAHGGRPEDAFHVVAISLPGFGFSGKPRERGFAPVRMAAIIATLMARLGYSRYGAQGGDWGGNISRLLAINDPGHVVGVHSNFCTRGLRLVCQIQTPAPAPELERMRARQAFFENERGYFLVQSTKPQTVSTA